MCGGVSTAPRPTSSSWIPGRGQSCAPCVRSGRGGTCSGTGCLLRRVGPRVLQPAWPRPCCPQRPPSAPSFLDSLLSRFLKRRPRPCFQESLCMPRPGLPCGLTLPPSPGAPHAASNPAWAGQRSCSVSSADQWSEASALSPGTQDPRRDRMAPRSVCAEALWWRGARAQGRGAVEPPGKGAGAPALPGLPVCSLPTDPVALPGPCLWLPPGTLPRQRLRPPPAPAGGCSTSPSAPCAASSSASPQGGAGERLRGRSGAGGSNHVLRAAPRLQGRGRVPCTRGPRGSRRGGVPACHSGTG